MSVDIGEDRGYIEALDSVDVRELLPAMHLGNSNCSATTRITGEEQF